MTFLIVSISVSLALSAWITMRLMHAGSDHYYHLFCIHAIRRCEGKLFTRVPGMLNEAYCSARPLLFYQLLACFSDSHIHFIAKWLNAIVSAAIVVLTYAFAKWAQLNDDVAGFASLLVAINPQAFHPFSARQYGLSVRGIGVLLFTILAMLSIRVHVEEVTIASMLCIVVTGYIIAGTNLFAQQTAVLVGAMCGLLGGMHGMWIGILVGFGILWIARPQYTSSYIANTFAFYKHYARVLAERFILKHRPSIWRELIWDTFFTKRTLLKELVHLHGNPVLIVGLMNPLVVICALIWITGTFYSPVQNACLLVCTGGVVAFVLTSFRKTRFLGEPQRYVEMVTPLSAVATSPMLLLSNSGWITCLCVLYVACQVSNVILIKYQAGKGDDFKVFRQQIIDAISACRESHRPRFASNNDEWMRRLMDQNWDYLGAWTSNTPYGMYRFEDVFREYPIAERGHFAATLAFYRVNYCLLERCHYSELDLSQYGGRVSTLLDTPKARLVRISWDSAAVAPLRVADTDAA